MFTGMWQHHPAMFRLGVFYWILERPELAEGV